jgi:PAS domain-containing protein
MTGNDGLNTLASVCNKQCMSNEISSPQTKFTPSLENTQPSQHVTGASARTNIFQPLQRIDPSMMPLLNSIGGQNHSQNMQNLLAAQLMESKRNSIFQRPYFFPNQQPLANVIAPSALNTGSFPTGYDSMTMNAMLLATRQGKLQNQNQKHDLGKTICFLQCSGQMFFLLVICRSATSLNSAVFIMSFLFLLRVLGAYAMHWFSSSKESSDTFHFSKNFNHTGNNIQHETDSQSNTNTDQQIKPSAYFPDQRESVPNPSDHRFLSTNGSDQYSPNAFITLNANHEARKDEKRAANRKAAQLSRKRKKLFIEELKEENDDLRRKEQILRSIPDLVIVFDTAGTLVFVSPSVINVLEFSPDELLNTSFWNRLCDDSVRLLKAAFMDALANREQDEDTSPLGTGLFEVKVKDKNGIFIHVTLNGVVNFAGETPECVCSIRPLKSSSRNAVEQLTKLESTPFVIESARSAKNPVKRVVSGRATRHGHSVAIIDADSANSAVSVSGSD